LFTYASDAELASRYTKFKVDALQRAGAEAVGAQRCISVVNVMIRKHERTSLIHGSTLNMCAARALVKGLLINNGAGDGWPGTDHTIQHLFADCRQHSQ
jgi:hypothetical protein